MYCFYHNSLVGDWGIMLKKNELWDILLIKKHEYVLAIQINIDTTYNIPIFY